MPTANGVVLTSTAQEIGCVLRRPVSYFKLLCAAPSKVSDCRTPKTRHAACHVHARAPLLRDAATHVHESAKPLQVAQDSWTHMFLPCLTDGFAPQGRKPSHGTPQSLLPPLLSLHARTHVLNNDEIRYVERMLQRPSPFAKKSGGRYLTPSCAHDQMSSFIRMANVSMVDGGLPTMASKL